MRPTKVLSMCKAEEDAETLVIIVIVMTVTYILSLKGSSEVDFYLRIFLGNLITVGISYATFYAV